MKKIISFIVMFVAFVVSAGAQTAIDSSAPLSQTWDQTNSNALWIDGAVTDYPTGITVQDTWTVRKAETSISVTEAGELSVLFDYTGGGHMLRVLGVDIIDADGNVADFDYHEGTTGGRDNNNTYSIKIISGTYTLRYFVAHVPGDSEITNSKGNITSSFAPFAVLYNTVSDKVESLAKLSMVYYPAETADARTSLQALSTITTIDECKTAYNSISSILETLYTAADGRVVSLQNNGSGTRNTFFLTYNDGYIRGILPSAASLVASDAQLWTLKYISDGKYKLYNAANDVYVGLPGSNPSATNEDGAASFEFIVTDNNKAALVAGDRMLHQSNTSPYNTINYYDLADAASIWTIRNITAKEIASLQAYMYKLQTKYGYIQDASNIISNKPETSASENSAYVHLIDGDAGTYFHSSWTDMGTDLHYLQFDLGETVSINEFYFYYRRRNDTNDNRPKKILVQGCDTEDGTYSDIDTLTNLPTADNIKEYFSGKITSTDSYRYLRFTIQETTNADTEKKHFFHFSEFYILPVNDETTAMSNLINTDFGTTNTTLSPTELKAAARTVIEGNPDYVSVLAKCNDIYNNVTKADVPALGEYTTEGITRLKAEIDDPNNTPEQLQQALVEVGKCKNRPLFRIISAYPDKKGAYIYDDAGTPKWGTASSLNTFNYTALWALDITATDVSVTDGVGIKNYGTNNNFWGCDAINIKETAEYDGYLTDGIFLFTTTDDATTIQPWDNPTIGRYSADAYNSASAWRFVYVTDTYTLDNYADELELREDVHSLQQNYSKLYTDIVLGAEYGEYSEIEAGSYTAFCTAMDDAVTKYAYTLDELVANETAATLQSTIDGIEDNIAKLQLNLPAAGHYLRINSVAHTAQYLSSVNSTVSGKETRAAYSDVAGENAIFYFDGSNLLSYGSGLYLCNRDDFAGYNGVQTSGTNFSFRQATTNEAGHYNVLYNNAGRAMYCKTSNSLYFTDAGDSGGLNANANVGYSFKLERVNALPVTISAAGYASLYAPTALEIPEGVTVYIGTTRNDVLDLTAIADVIPANTAVIITGTVGSTYDFTILDENDATLDIYNELRGTVATINATDVSSPYTLQMHNDIVGMYQYIGATLKGFRAYLGNVFLQASLIKLRFPSLTGVSGAVVDSSADEDAVYDLTGRKLEFVSRPGIYIVGGKKVVIE